MYNVGACFTPYRWHGNFLQFDNDTLNEKFLQPRQIVNELEGKLDLNSWKSYYEWRGFQLNDLASFLLHWPLTIYHCLANLLPLHCKC